MCDGGRYNCWMALAMISVMAMSVGCARFREVPPPERAPVDTPAYYDRAGERAREILQQLESRLGADHPALIDPLMTLSMVSFRQNRMEEADELLERVWTLVETTPELAMEDLDLPTRYGSLPAAARAGDRMDVRLHLVQDADVNAIDARGMTALHYAAVHGDENMGRMLIENGAIVTLRDRQRKTARDYAREHEYAEIVALLDPRRIAELRPDREPPPDAAEPVEPPEDADSGFDELEWFEVPAEDTPPVTDVFEQPEEVEDDLFY